MVSTPVYYFQNPVTAQPGLGTQPGEIWVKYEKKTKQKKQKKTHWLTSGEWGYPLDNGPKMIMGQLNNSQNINKI